MMECRETGRQLVKPIQPWREGWTIQKETEMSNLKELVGKYGEESIVRVYTGHLKSLEAARIRAASPEGKAKAAAQRAKVAKELAEFRKYKESQKRGK